MGSLGWKTVQRIRFRVCYFFLKMQTLLNLPVEVCLIAQDSLYPRLVPGASGICLARSADEIL